MSGRCQAIDQVPRSHLCLCTESVDQQTQDRLTNHWHVEEVSPSATELTKEQELAVVHFDTTHTQMLGGRYVVEFPRKTDALPLGCSREQAVRRHKQNVRSLKRKGKWQEFEEAVWDYAKRGHSERVPADDQLKSECDCFYMPMHGVIKEQSITIKLQVVVDASAHTSSGVSLNDQLLPGPHLYLSMSTSVTTFRMHLIGLTSDIGKMFREVALASTEKDYHRFVVEMEDRKMEDWRMTRLTFGVTSLPFLATKVLWQIAKDHREEFPKAAAVISTWMTVLPELIQWRMAWNLSNKSSS